MKIIRIDGDRSVDQEIERVVLELNGDKYTITKSVDNKLCINKTGDDDTLCIYSRYSNEIELR
jgi:hypothetical protein